MGVAILTGPPHHRTLGPERRPLPGHRQCQTLWGFGSFGGFHRGPVQISPRHESKKQCNVSDPGEDLRDDKEHKHIDSSHYAHVYF